MPRKDLEANRAYNKAYRAKNKPWLTEQSKLRGKAWYGRAKIKDPKILLLRAARSRASAKGIEFCIDRSDFEMPLVCPLLGVWMVPANGSVRPNSPSLDRIDSTRGYVPGNVWVISYKANAMKNDASALELLAFARNVINLFASEK